MRKLVRCLLAAVALSAITPPIANADVDFDRGGPSVLGTVWMDADADRPANPAALVGDTVYLGALESANLNVRAVTEPARVGSVAFYYDGRLARVENVAPYALAGNAGRDYTPWTPTVGAHRLELRAYSGPGRSGLRGPSVTIEFTVDAGAPPSASPLALPHPTPPAPEPPTSEEPVPAPEPEPPAEEEPAAPAPRPPAPAPDPSPASWVLGLTPPLVGPAVDLALRPFSASSPWNTPTSASTRYGPSNDPRLADLPNSTYINAAAYSIPVFVARSSDPLTTITSPEGTITIHAPSDATNATGTDGNFTIVDPTHTQVDEFWIATRTGPNRWHSERHVHNDLNGSGTDGGIRAAGFSVLGGLIREHDVDRGAIDHALTVIIPSESAKRGYVPPAISEDGYASWGYSGSIPLGTRFAIPRSVNLDGLGLTAEGKLLARALQEYGGYVGDTGYPGNGGNAVLVAEPTLEGSTALTHMRSDLHRIVAELRPVL